MSAPAGRVAAVVLAAGEGRRFGSQKLLAPLGDRPLLQHALDAANASSLSPIIVVLGADADRVAAGVRTGRARLVRNPDHATGQAGSLRIGLRSLDDSDAAVIVLGDRPNVTAALLDALVAAQRSSGAPAVVCAQDGRRSPPTLLHRDLWAAVDALPRRQGGVTCSPTARTSPFSRCRKASRVSTTWTHGRIGIDSCESSAPAP